MATFTLPSDPSDGQVAPASWGDDVRAALSFLANPPACRVYHNTAQSIANNSEVALTFNSERYDTDSMHSTSVNPSRITFNTTGLYVVSLTFEFAPHSTGRRYGVIKLGGTTGIAVALNPTAEGTFGHGFSISTIYKFTAGEFVEAKVYQNSGGALNVLNSPNFSPEFAATWLGLG